MLKKETERSALSLLYIGLFLSFKNM